MPPPPLDPDTLAGTLRLRGAGDAKANVRATLRGDTVVLPGTRGARRAALPRLSIDLAPPRDGAAPAEGRSDHDVIVQGVLGEGGMGRVYLARQSSLDRDVAVKALREGKTASAAIDALVDEGVVTGRLEHPNIPPVHQLGVDAEGRPLLVMKRIEGASWADLLDDDDHPLIAAQGARDRLGAHLRILTEITRALEYAHARGVVHRDLKPENVMVGAFGEVYLVDFGIATRLGAVRPRGDVAGTPAFMAPEMVDDGARLDARTDVYLLGATLHLILTGRARHEAPSLLETLLAAYESAPYAYGPEVPSELAALANRATARDPAERPADAAAFRAALGDFASHREARETARAALERLCAVESALADGEEIVPRADDFGRRVGEARFGMELSLRAWPACPEARDGLSRCLRAIVRIEVAKENLASASAALAELADPDPALVADVDALRERIRRRDEDAERMRKLDASRDVRRNLRLRRLAAIALIVNLAIAMAVLAGKGLMRGELPVTSGSSLLRTSVVMTFLVVGTATVVHLRLPKGSLTRKLASVLSLTVVAELVHRAIAAKNGLDSRTILPADLTIVAAVLGAVGTLVARVWLVPAFVCLGCALASYVVPGWTELLYVFGLGVAIVSLGVGLREET